MSTNDHWQFKKDGAADALPEGWGATEFAASQLRQALASWNDREAPALYLDRGWAMARAAEKLLAELDKDRVARADVR